MTTEPVAGMQDDPLLPLNPEYPDTAIGSLMRQRDQILATVVQDDGMAAAFTAKAQDGRDRAAQLQAAINVMPPELT